VAAFQIRGCLALTVAQLAGLTLLASPVRLSGPSADLIRIEVTVTDAQGHPVSGLKQEDFELKVDDQPRAIESFAIGPVRLSAVILVDVTASLHLCPAGVAGIPSTAPRSGSSLRTSRLPGPIPPAVDHFGLAGIESGDRVRVGSIGRTLTVSSAATTDPSQLAKDWRTVFERPPIDWLGPSPIYDAAFEAVGLAANESGRRVVILVTDGQASGNARSYLDVANAAADAGVSVSAVAEGLMVPTLPMRPLSDFGFDFARHLRSLAQLTGGLLVMDPGAWDQDGPCYRRGPGQALSKLLEALRRSYVIGFSGSGVAEGRLGLKAKDSRLVVHSPATVAREKSE
jgi:hypothetical protein